LKNVLVSFVASGEKTQLIGRSQLTTVQTCHGTSLQQLTTNN